MTENNIASILKALKPLVPSRLDVGKEFIGKKFGKLTILDIPGRSRTRKCIMTRCVCECGNLTVVALSDVKRSHTTSCGCRLMARRNIHGEASSIDRKASNEYTAWSRARTQSYKARRNTEITVGDGFGYCDISLFICDRWMEKDKGYLNFLEDMGRKPLKSRLKKHDKTKPYDKDNCYWRNKK